MNVNAFIDLNLWNLIGVQLLETDPADMSSHEVLIRFVSI
jgi:hypothetical protein